jgi:hypothetical protein
VVRALVGDLLRTLSPLGGEGRVEAVVGPQVVSLEPGRVFPLSRLKQGCG